MKKLDFDEIEFHPEIENPRGDLGNIDELAADIDANGLRYPPVVWGKKEDEGVHYYMIDGFRRHAAISKLRAGDESKFASLPALIIKGTTDEMRHAVLAYNLHREDWKAPDAARYIRKLIKWGFSQTEIATKIGKTQPYVSQLASFGESAVSSVQDAVAAGEIPLSAGRKISEAPEEQQSDLLEVARKAADEKKSAAKAVERARGKSNRPSIKEIKASLKYIPETVEGDMANGVILGVEAAIRWVLGEDGFESMEKMFDFVGIKMPDLPPEPEKKRGRPRVAKVVDPNAPKRSRGRPALSDEEKAARKKARDEAKAVEKAEAKSKKIEEKESAKIAAAAEKEIAKAAKKAAKKSSKKAAPKDDDVADLAEEMGADADEIDDQPVSDDLPEDDDLPDLSDDGEKDDDLEVPF